MSDEIKVVQVGAVGAAAAQVSAAAAALNAQQTAADRVQTGQDAAATAADRVATGQDVVTATNKANIATQAAAQAVGVLDDPSFVAVSEDLPNIDIVAGAKANVDVVAGISGNVTTLAGVAGGVTALVPHADDISTLAPHAADVTTAAANIAAIQNAPAAAAGAAASDADATAQAQASQGFALTAAAQAALSYTFALSSATAQQQDLSAITKQIHFSPNAILGTLFYDTGKDSNPAWVDQVQNASYMFETLNGNWLVPNLGGAGFPNELTARYVIPNAVEGVNFSVVGAPTIVAGAGGYIQNNGTNGNCISVPHSAANSPSGVIDITLAAKANLPSWTAPAATIYFGSTGFAGNGGLALQLTNAGKISITWGNGATTIPAISTVALTQAPNTDLWVAARLQCNNGGVYTVTFWSSTDGVAWAPVGAAVNGAAATTVAAASNNLFVAANSAGTGAVNGKLYAYQMLLNGLPGVGTVVSKFDGNAITTNATGSYFQNATDGKHYSLNAGAGVTQTTNGNSNKPPRVWAIVWEAGYLCIYDPTKPGCPLWKSFLTTAAAPISALGSIAAGTLVANGVRAAEGQLWIGSNQGFLCADFANDQMALGRNPVYTLADRRIAARNAQPTAALIGGVNGMDGFLPAGNTTLGIFTTVLPDSPVNSNTGLLKPMVLVTSSGGLTLIKDDGSAPIINTNSGTTGLGAITPWYVAYATSGGQVFNFALGSPRTLGTNFAATALAANATQFNATSFAGLVAANRSLVAKFFAGVANTTPPHLTLMRFNASNPAASLFADITPYSSTGWVVGSIAGCWLSDILSGNATGTEQVTNGTFAADVSGWTSTANMVWSAGQLQVTVTAGGTRASQALNLTPGKTYAINGSMQAAAGNAINNTASIRVNINGNYVFAQPVTAKGVTQNVVNQQFTVPYGALTTCQVELLVASTNQFGNVGDSATFDNISIVEVAADRSLNANPLFITGSLARAAANAATQIMLYSGWSAANYAHQAYSASLDPGTAGVTESIWGTIPANVATAGTAVDRSAAAGAYYTFGHDATGKLTATVFDGTTTRTVTTAASYATGQLFKARMILSPSGTLSISVNGAPVASTPGAPLLSLNNAAAVLTVGNRRALDQPWAGGLALVRIGTTIPTLEQSALCYEQEYMMFQPGAVCALADATALQDLRYDASQQKFKAVSSGYENSLVGLTFSAQAACSAGTFSHCDHLGGMKLLARATTNPGVDIMVPAYALREELANRDRAAAERARLTQCLDFTGGFTATTTNGGTALTSVAGWTYPSQTNPRGEVATGSGIPASTSITDVVGATAYLSAAATAGASGVQIALTDFALPVGYEAIDVFAAGSLKVEGATNDYTRLFDGFRETIRFPGGAPPGYSAKVHINARRYAQ
jgi:hypothetical protein